MKPIIISLFALALLTILAIHYENNSAKLHTQIDTLKARNARLLERKIVYDTIRCYIIKGVK